MFSHIVIGSNDIEGARAFYTAVLGVLGASEPLVNVNLTGQTRLFFRHNHSVLVITQPINGEPATVANGATIGFACESPEQLTLFHDTAVANGGTSIEDPPGLRENSLGLRYLCYFRDPDGHKICGLYVPPPSA